MQSYLDNQPITVVIPLVDSNGDPLSPLAVRYRVADQDDVELIAETAIIDFTDSVTVVVPGVQNVLATGSPRALRVVELFVDIDGGTIRLEDGYYIEASDVLVEGENSFQTYRRATFGCFELPNLSAWVGASKQEQTSAMIAAWRNIGKLRFRFLYDNYQDAIEQSVSMSDLTLATHAQWSALPTAFKEAVCRAQIIEADYLLGGDELGEFRRAGLLSMTVGEAKQFFRTSKPVEGVVCKRAMSELSRYVMIRTLLARS